MAELRLELNTQSHTVSTGNVFKTKSLLQLSDTFCKK